VSAFSRLSQRKKKWKWKEKKKKTISSSDQTIYYILLFPSPCDGLVAVVSVARESNIETQAATL